MEWIIRYYKEESGNIPVIEYMQTLPIKQRARIRKTIDLLEKYGVSEPFFKTKKLRGCDRLWQIRISYSRIIYFLHIRETIILLHGFTKKSNKTPVRELKIALKRMKKIIE